jgi:hypothetical protein
MTRLTSCIKRCEPNYPIWAAGGGRRIRKRRRCDYYKIKYENVATLEAKQVKEGAQGGIQSALRTLVISIRYSCKLDELWLFSIQCQVGRYALHEMAVTQLSELSSFSPGIEPIALRY